MNANIADTFTKGMCYVNMAKAGLILVLDNISNILDISKIKARMMEESNNVVQLKLSIDVACLWYNGALTVLSLI